MSIQWDVSDHGRHSVGENTRQRLLAGLPVRERQLQLGGIATVVLEGGDGPPLVLLHGPGGNAAHWMRVIPELVTTHRVIAPDLPGQGESVVAEGLLNGERVVAWLAELIERTCASPPALAGFALGGAIAARFASREPDRLGRLVLVDTLGLVPFDPTPDFGRALSDFLTQPTERAHDLLWRRCAADLDRLRQQMGERWEPFRAYNVERASTPSARAALDVLMAQLGAPPIPPADLAHIVVPTSLIWGRYDLATRLAVAESTSARYRWPLHVIEDCGDDPPLEQPDAFLRALHVALVES